MEKGGRREGKKERKRREEKRKGRGGPSRFLFRFRGHHPRRQLRRGQRHHLGQRRLGIHRAGRRPREGAEAGEADVSDVREEDVRRMGAGEDSRPLAERQRVAAAEASRSIRERQDRHHGSRAAFGGVEQRRRRDRRRSDLAKQSESGWKRRGNARRSFARERTHERTGEESGQRISESAIAAISSETLSSNFLSESKLARSIPSESGTHSTSSTSLSCGVSAPPVCSMR